MRHEGVVPGMRRRAANYTARRVWECTSRMIFESTLFSGGNEDLVFFENAQYNIVICGGRGVALNVSEVTNHVFKCGLLGMGHQCRWTDARDYRGPPLSPSP